MVVMLSLPSTCISSAVTTAQQSFDEQLASARTVEQFSALLGAHPDKGDTIVPLLELAIINHIRTKGPDSRLVIKGFAPPDTESAGALSLLREPGAQSVTAKDEFPADSGAVTVRHGELATYAFFGPGADGSVTRYAGEIPCDLMGVHSFVGEGDKYHRLTFAVVRHVGFVYLRGQGKVVFSDGKEVSLGKMPTRRRPTQKPK
jgi:hypothetical protein